ncbi:MAG TPA: YheC/YheD family protein [Sporolactobacillaceae bacterium]|nr:YheC/YheD family protein [Sporolactobacillaceae bacterium]
MDIVKIGKRKEGTATVYVPHALYRNNKGKVRFSYIEEPCGFIETENDTCIITEDLWDQLGLPFPSKLRIKVLNDTLHFFPIIGLFTTGYTEGSLYPFGQRTSDYRRLLAFTESKGGFAYILTPDHIDWENKKIRGIFYRHGKWSEHTVPFPQIIYDRVPNRKAEHSPKVKQAKNRLQEEHGIPWFNPGFFDKWEIMESLQKHPLSVQYLPKTFDFNHQTLKRSLETYPSIYIKPKNTSHGVGIKHIKMVDGKIYCSENKRTGSIEKEYENMTDFINKEFSEHHPSQYILQQAITLPETGGQHFDFRVHTNKDGAGQWQLSAVAAKVADVERLTTHVVYGGEVKTLGEIYGRKKALSILEQIKDAALTLSEIIDQNTDGLIGELGLDLVIDHEQRLWLFEANSKPGRAIFTKPAIRKQANLIDHYWFDYCCHLAELVIKRPDWLLSEV